MTQRSGTAPLPCPYKALPDTAYWRRAVSQTPPAEIDPVVGPKFTIGPQDRLATAGSCFAQHISRYMQKSGFNYFVPEAGHPVLDPGTLAAYNYGTFSARYGNIYTTRQLLQTCQRAYGTRQPHDDVWTAPDGSLVDPFRPWVQPGGFDNAAAYAADRAQHFAAIRRIVEEADVFVFTLGLTEAWENVQDGTVYALCPGCGAGTHDPDAHRFRNFTVAEVAEDLAAAIGFMRARNPALKVLLTVSPVPLIATFEAQHVLTATTYSKSVLRVTAQMVADAHPQVDYFPSYEIITGAFSRGAYYGPDLREVKEVGVAHAMRCFFRNYLGQEVADPAQSAPGSESKSVGQRPALAQPVNSSLSARINDVVCDEARLEDI